VATELATIEAPVVGKVAEAFYNHDGSWRQYTDTGHVVRYRVLFGGRGGGKSEGVARIYVMLARSETARFLCARMYQNSINDSVHRTIAEAIEDLGLLQEFDILKSTIIHRATKSDFIFKGIQRDINGIKSLKGVKYCWVEEAESVPAYEWQVLDPTLRVEGSEFAITYNPDLEGAATHQLFNLKAPPEAIVQEINWRDNPWFPPVLERLRSAAQRSADAGSSIDQAAYDWIWEGKCRRLTDAMVFRDRVKVEDFVEPPDMRPFYGADWGFANDPTTLIRSYVLADNLFITHEAFGWHVEIDDIPQAIFDQVPDSRKWPIKGDAAQPAIISYLKRKGFNISAAEKWPGSVEDGIAYMKGFKTITVHPRCKNIIQEFRLYSWKTDPKQLDENGQPLVLPILVDKYNHGIDAVRYSLDGYIQSKGPIVFDESALELI
jgi:phage terminase large subunit